MGVSSHFCGFLIDLVQKAAILCHISYVCNHYKTNFLYSHGAGYRYFEDSSAVNLGLLCFEKAVALPSKKIIIIRRIWRFSGMAQFHRNATCCDKCLPLNLRIFGITKQHLRIPRQDFLQVGKSTRKSSKIAFCAFYKGFTKFSRDPYYELLSRYLLLYKRFFYYASIFLGKEMLRYVVCCYAIIEDLMECLSIL